MWNEYESLYRKNTKFVLGRTEYGAVVAEITQSGKAGTPYEMTPEQARALAADLVRLADRVEKSDECRVCVMCETDFDTYLPDWECNQFRFSRKSNGTVSLIVTWIRELIMVSTHDQKRLATFFAGREESLECNQFRFSREPNGTMSLIVTGDPSMTVSMMVSTQDQKRLAAFFARGEGRP